MTYEFKVGDKGKTRGGFDYEVIAIDARLGDYPMVVIVNKGHGMHAVSRCFPDGKQHSPLIGDTRGDLIPPPRKLTFYVNGYGSMILGYSSDVIARAQANGSEIFVARKVEFEIEGGAL